MYSDHYQAYILGHVAEPQVDHGDYHKQRIHPATDFTELSYAIRWAIAEEDNESWDPDDARPNFFTGRCQNIEELVPLIEHYAHAPYYHILDHDKYYSAGHPTGRSKVQSQFNYPRRKGNGRR